MTRSSRSRRSPDNTTPVGAGSRHNGTQAINAAGDGFLGSGEVHGVLRLPETFNAISFTHTSENWHGFTVRVLALGEPNGAREHGSIALLGLALT